MRPFRTVALTTAFLLLLGGVAYTAPSKKTDRIPSTAGGTVRGTGETKRGDTKTPDVQDGKQAVDQNSQPAVSEIESEPVHVTGQSTQDRTASGRKSGDGLAIDWLSINGGGATELAAGNIRLGVSIAQPVAGEVSAGDLRMGLGFWYGAVGGTGGSCDCSHAGDLDGSSTITATDLQLLIQVVFFNASDVQDPTCPVTRGDVNCNGLTNVTDMQHLIEHIFFGADLPCDGCASAGVAAR